MFRAATSGSVDVVLIVKSQLRRRVCERELETECDADAV
jgi:hypothetical protein